MNVFNIGILTFLFTRRNNRKNIRDKLLFMGYWTTDQLKLLWQFNGILAHCIFILCALLCILELAVHSVRFIPLGLTTFIVYCFGGDPTYYYNKVLDDHFMYFIFSYICNNFNLSLLIINAYLMHICRSFIN